MLTGSRTIPGLNPALKMSLMRVLSPAVSLLQVFGPLPPPPDNQLKISDLRRNSKIRTYENVPATLVACRGIIAALHFRIDENKFSFRRKFIFIYTKKYFRLNENLRASIRKCVRLSTRVEDGILYFYKHNTKLFLL